MPARSILRDTKRQQRNWANARELAIDQYGYLPDHNSNLFLPLSAGFAAALEAAGGGETTPRRHMPPKIRAVHSSVVLAINVFQYWEDRTGPELPRALGFDGELAAVQIEQQYSSGLKGMPPTLDVSLTLNDGPLVAIESKFTEWMTRKKADLPRLRDKYLRPGTLWDDIGLPRCQQLAAAIAAGAETFLQLDAPQLLKHALGLGTSAARPFALMYLYHDYANTAAMADRHREEIARFTGLVDDRLGFAAMSYQQLIAGLAATPGVDSDYVHYLQERYY